MDIFDTLRETHASLKLRLRAGIVIDFEDHDNPFTNNGGHALRESQSKVRGVYQTRPLFRADDWLSKHQGLPQKHEDFWEERMMAFVYMFRCGDLFSTEMAWLKATETLRTPENEAEVRKRARDYQDKTQRKIKDTAFDALVRLIKNSGADLSAWREAGEQGRLSIFIECFEHDPIGVCEKIFADLALIVDFENIFIGRCGERVPWQLFCRYKFTSLMESIWTWMIEWPAERDTPISNYLFVYATMRDAVTHDAIREVVEKLGYAGKTPCKEARMGQRNAAYVPQIQGVQQPHFNLA
ncbi:hypothetical protein Slin15195_G073250 [Septoria linicola]|uniref:Uncharacterized protein n=1 Tax=Septoria linicola TaxID=215465 RepID=A0A9Q9AYB3_9PEZI|nr:hypothetical protein Slin15195_G073250 [Septoria linicola]